MIQFLFFFCTFPSYKDINIYFTTLMRFGIPKKESEEKICNYLLLFFLFHMKMEISPSSHKSDMCMYQKKAEKL